MKASVLALLASLPLLAADPRQLATALKAQTDFERVALMARPRIADTDLCLQSQAAALPLSAPEERSLLYYRRGYCAFARAAVTQDPGHFPAAVSEFDKAMDAWPAREPRNVKHPVAVPVPAALRIFAAIARLQAGADASQIAAARQEIATALESKSCDASLIDPLFCGHLLAAGGEWLGWIALGDSRLGEAQAPLAGDSASGWGAWVQGRRDFEAARYAAAARLYAAAIDRWKLIWRGDGPTFLQALGPRPQYAAALADLGAAQMLAGDHPSAIRTLDTSLQIQAANPHALFLRARAKELAGRKDEALADYNLASRSAFAAAQDLASGEAHLYRGIVLYRRLDFARAEEEFSSALNFEMTGALRPDARAWRHLAAVAGGSCGEARQSLNLALSTVSPFFPQAEARSLVAACATSAQGE